jgi:hypothetical protein
MESNTIERANFKQFRISMKREKLTLVEKPMELCQKRRRSGSSCRLLTLHAFHNPLCLEGKFDVTTSLYIVNYLSLN